MREFAASPVGSVRVRYYAWLQWQLDRQLAAAAGTLPVVSDLAVGVDPGGPDAWLWQDAFVDAMRVGAPPDRFNTRGQDWALLPFDPWRLRAAGYEPWIQSLRGALRHGGGLRLDHVMGLFRLYWVPAGAPRPGKAPTSAIPPTICSTSWPWRPTGPAPGSSARTWGPSRTEVRLELSRRNVLSYKVWWFEADPPSAWPVRALGAISTHDLPTVAGVAGGSDLAAQRRLGLEPDEEAAAELQAKLMSRTGSGRGHPRAGGGRPGVRRSRHRALPAAGRQPRRRPGPRGAAQHAGHRGRVAQLAAGAARVPLEELEQMALPRRIAASLGRPEPARGPAAMSPEAGGGP